MIAVFKDDVFVEICKTPILKYQTDPAFTCYEIEFNDEPSLYEFVLDIKGKVKWFRQVQVLKQLHTSQGFFKANLWQRLKFLFLGRY